MRSWYVAPLFTGAFDMPRSVLPDSDAGTGSGELEPGGQRIAQRTEVDRAAGAVSVTS